MWFARHRAATLVAVLATLMLALPALHGCAGSCGENDALAELSGVAGPRVERDAASAPGTWQKARPRDRFRMGDGLRTGADSRAELHLFPTGVAYIEPRTLLRFLESAPRTQGVAVESGSVEIVAEQMDLEIHTPRAVAKVTRGSKLKLSTADGHERFDLVVGRVFVSQAQNDPLELRVGEPLQLGSAPLAAPVVEPESGPKNAAAVAEPADPGPAMAKETVGLALAVVTPSAGASASAGPSLVQPPPAPARAELTLPAMESSTIHAPQLPVEVRLGLPPCPEGAKLLLGGRSLPSSDRDGVLRLPAGRHRLRVLCGAEVTHDSQIVVKRDAARLELPKRAQSVRVEADGRRYTVLYQNLLPIVSFVWPGAHEGNEFTLLLRRGKREQSFALRKPEHALAGSALGEGEHNFWFRDQAGRSSKPGSVRLSFDNAARSAYLSSPAEGSAAQGAVLVEGAALLRSEVQVDGRPVQLDEKGRFRSEVTLSTGQRTISVRVQHPESGVHYYLRHLR